ncbi:MAG: UDP-N-acetylmuramoyl-L-alanyl-D-glutamate--2,6-diaminopimelate ligase [Pleomorphochaeta sp.]
MKSLNLDKYLLDSYYLQYPKDIEIKHITFNSKLVRKNSIFVAIKGFKQNGNDYIDEAIKNNASLIVSEDLPTTNIKEAGFLVVKNARLALSFLSRMVYNFPDKKLKIIAITGTDGKTSTSFYTYSLLKSLNYKVGLICTTNLDTNGELVDSPYRQSTPDSNILFQLLDECVVSNKEYVIIEATSHALSKEFNRLSDIKFDACIITTITNEHLDFHKTRENYINTKLNIIEKLKSNGFLVTTNKNKELDKCIEKAKASSRDYYILEKEFIPFIEQNNILKPISIFYNEKEYNTNIYFDIFINNVLLAALLISKLTKIALEDILSNIINIEDIKGRFNIINNNINRLIIIDFAHTADAFNKIFSQMLIEKRKIITVFGCGGERDINKRYDMGKIAAQYSDIIVLSEEDPRFEDNIAIMHDIEKGILSIDKKCNYYCINNRNEAINKALRLSNENDILLFLGKGHETSIERKGIKYPYNEKTVIKEEIKKIYG